jgi:hypothetical protein
LEALNLVGESLRRKGASALARGTTAVVASTPNVVAEKTFDLIELLIEEQEIEPAIRREVTNRVNVTAVFLASIGDKSANAFSPHIRPSVNPDFLY